ncbi:recombinase RecX [Shewanella putrefaciens]|nr:recombinase RecX [Shewanella putrefaciens]
MTEVKGSKARELIAKEKAKRVRFLMGQGFSYDQISYALDSDPNDLDEDD